MESSVPAIKIVFMYFINQTNKCTTYMYVCIYMYIYMYIYIYIHFHHPKKQETPAQGLQPQDSPDCTCSHQTYNFHVLKLLMFYDNI
jgi:hypothetical protein